MQVLWLRKTCHLSGLNHVCGVSSLLMQKGEKKFLLNCSYQVTCECGTISTPHPSGRECVLPKPHSQKLREIIDFTGNEILNIAF